MRFDFALSFSGAQRITAEQLRDGLVAGGYRVFYDRDFEHEMIGRNGADYLRNIYSHESKYCVVLISQEYDSSTWTSLEKESIQSREIRGDEGVLIPILCSNYVPQWLPATRIYFDLAKRGLKELLRILSQIALPDKLSLASVSTQDDLYRALPGTTWRKRNGVEQLIFKDGGLFFNNHAGHPAWRENYYRIETTFRKMTVMWSIDGFTTGCTFAEDFSSFSEDSDAEIAHWDLLALQPHTPPWGV